MSTDSNDSLEETVTEKIDRYFQHFKKECKRISLISGESSLTFRKTLYCSLLDALSNSWADETLKPRQRVVSFISKFGCWSNANNVSLSHLSRLLDFVPANECLMLRQAVKEKLNNWKGPWGGIPISEDPSLEEINDLLSKDGKPKGYKIASISTESLTHLHLFYSYRNCLVHELRNPGYGFEFPDDKEEEPFYHELSTTGSAEEPSIETFELVYPVRFFELLIEKSMAGLEQYLRENDCNPFKRYKFGSYWLGELNSSD